MKKNILFTLIGASIIILLSIIIWLVLCQSSQPKIAYVKSIYLVENYKGTKEAYQVLQKRAVEWQVQLDSLKELYQQSFQNYKEKKDKLEGEELKLLEKDILLKQSNFERYQKIVAEKESEEGSKLTQGVYAQIDSYLKAYAKQQGYDLVIGANAEGTVLYGSDKFDITEEILSIINQKYEGGRK